LHGYNHKIVTLKKEKMNHLPLNDAAMLMSMINQILRDNLFENLDAICEHYEVERELVEKKLAEAGFEYSEELNKIW
jgi:hypothetical protein